MIRQYNPQNAIDAIQKGALFIDVREVDEVEERCYDVKNYTNIPLSDFQDRFSELPKDKELIMACRSGGRSLNACAFLASNGYQNLSNLEGGILGWERSGFPIKK